MQQQDDMKTALRRLERKVHQLEREKAQRLWDRGVGEVDAADANPAGTPSKVRMARSESLPSGAGHRHTGDDAANDEAAAAAASAAGGSEAGDRKSVALLDTLDAKSSKDESKAAEYRKRSYSESALKHMLHGLSATHHANRLAAKHYDYRTISDQRVSPFGRPVLSCCVRYCCSVARLAPQENPESRPPGTRSSSSGRPQSSRAQSAKHASASSAAAAKLQQDRRFISDPGSLRALANARAGGSGGDLKDSVSDTDTLVFAQDFGQNDLSSSVPVGQGSHLTKSLTASSSNFGAPSAAAVERKPMASPPRSAKSSTSPSSALSPSSSSGRSSSRATGSTGGNTLSIGMTVDSGMRVSLSPFGAPGKAAAPAHTQLQAQHQLTPSGSDESMSGLSSYLKQEQEHSSDRDPLPSGFGCSSASSAASASAAPAAPVSAAAAAFAASALASSSDASSSMMPDHVSQDDDADMLDEQLAARFDLDSASPFTDSCACSGDEWQANGNGHATAEGEEIGTVPSPQEMCAIIEELKVSCFLMHGCERTNHNAARRWSRLAGRSTWTLRSNLRALAMQVKRSRSSWPHCCSCRS